VRGGAGGAGDGRHGSPVGGDAVQPTHEGHGRGGSLAALWRLSNGSLPTALSNGSLRQVTDVEAVCAIARAHGAASAVDATWLSPYNMQPLRLGADLVVHSTTKYIGGHSDLTGGMVVGGGTEHGRALFQKVQHVQRTCGSGMAPFDCWLALRGMRSLAVRMRTHCANAQAVASFLLSHPAVSAVHYPGLPRHPGHATAARQMRLPGGMVSFQLRGGGAGSGGLPLSATGGGLTGRAAAVAAAGALKVARHSLPVAH
jgi:O-acetylhomoserine/O-acetylserine sulfhydrylase-like pyridoxal-dependent enzyme